MFLSCQIEYLLWLQNLRELTNGIFDGFFLTITHSGELLIPFVFVALFYWCLNRKIGEFMLLAHAFGLALCQFLKMMFCINRPWILSDKIKPVPKALDAASGFSFPSGHTECAMTTWGAIAAGLWHKKIIRYSIITIILLIAFSRNYLGVHTPQDVLVSILVGTIILILGKKILDKMETDKSLEWKLLLLGFALTTIIGIIVWNKPMPENNLTGSASNFRAMSNFLSSLGYCYGTIGGWFLCRKFVDFKTDGIKVLTKILRFIFGATILLIIFLYCKDILVADFGALKGRFAHFFLIGIFTTFIYPWIFTKIEKTLAKRNS